MAVSFVQSANNAATTGTTATCAFTTAPALNNGLIAYIGIADQPQTITDIHDTVGNTWVSMGTAMTNTVQGWMVFGYYCAANKTNAANTVSVTASATGGFIELQIYEVAPGAGNNKIVFDQYATGNANTLNLSIGPTGTLAAASEFASCYSMTNGTIGTIQSGWTANPTTLGNFGQYIVTTATTAITATNTMTGTGGWGGVLSTVQGGSTGTVTVNATVHMAGKAISGLVLNPRITKDATFFCSAGGHATFTCDLGAFGHAILLARATSSTFTGQSVQLRTERTSGFATATFRSFLTHSASVALRGSAGTSQFGGGSTPTLINATVHLFGFAANNIAINQFLGRASLRLIALIPVDQVSLDGRAILSPNPQITRNFSDSLRANAKMALTGTVTGAGNINAVLVINGRASITTARSLINKGAQVVIQAGNPLFIPVEGKISLMGRARITSSAFVTHAPQVLIGGRAALAPNVTLGGTNNIFGGVHFAGRAVGRFLIPPALVPGVLSLRGQATLTPNVTNIVSLSATLAIRGRANASFSATVQGSLFNNAVVSLLGKAVVTPSAFRLVRPTVGISGLANMMLFPGGTVRASILLAGFAHFIPQVPKQLLQWASDNTLQYKVWQYNMENMTRVLGTSWTATSTGLSFQAVALELQSTEAGWGS